MHKGDEAETLHTYLGHKPLHKLCILAHLSQRLIGELIVYKGPLFVCLLSTFSNDISEAEKLTLFIFHI